MSTDTCLTRALHAMAVGRIALGAGSVLAPGAMARSFGTDDSAELRYLTRVFGARAIALGTAYLLAGPAERTRLQRLCVGVDISDTAAALEELLLRQGPRRPLVSAALVTGPYAVIGAARLMRDLRR